MLPETASTSRPKSKKEYLKFPKSSPNIARQKERSYKGSCEQGGEDARGDGRLAARGGDVHLDGYRDGHGHSDVQWHGELLAAERTPRHITLYMDLISTTPKRHDCTCERLETHGAIVFRHSSRINPSIFLGIFFKNSFASKVLFSGRTTHQDGFFC